MHSDTYIEFLRSYVILERCRAAPFELKVLLLYFNWLFDLSFIPSREKGLIVFELIFWTLADKAARQTNNTNIPKHSLVCFPKNPMRDVTQTQILNKITQNVSSLKQNNGNCKHKVAAVYILNTIVRMGRSKFC